MSPEKRGETFVMRDAGAPGPIGFDAFILGLASTTMIHLGLTAHPETGVAEKNLVLARETLELLGMLREKTRGNLTPGEDKLFEQWLADLRMRFVDASKT